MEHAPHHKSHTPAWTFSIIAVLLIYILSLGPLDYLYSAGLLETYPRWLQHLYYPLTWLETTPAGTPLQHYDNWWVRKGVAHHPPIPTQSVPINTNTITMPQSQPTNP